MKITSRKNIEAVRRFRVRQLYVLRGAEDSKATGILPFYGWLVKYLPDLLPQGNDPYQALKVDLSGLYEDQLNNQGSVE